MGSKAIKRFGCAFLAALVLGTSFAGAANASPAWRFNGTELAGSETIVGDAVLSSMTIPGITTSCKKMHYEMTISNSAGTGQGELTSLNFKTCFTSSKVCTVKTIKAEKLPWATSLITVAPDNFIVISGIRISILYAGAECALGEVVATVTGSTAGLYDNTSETFTLSAKSAEAAKVELKAFASKIAWNGAFTTEATGAHKGEALTVS